MDTSETYIKMCDCPEIQELRHTMGQLDTILWGPKSVYVMPNLVGNQSLPLIWLPRQDQLQEMVVQKYELARGVLHRFVEWERENSGLTTKYIEFNSFSMEQLWLAFVMKEKHNKVWNGEVWE